MAFEPRMDIESGWIIQIKEGLEIEEEEKERSICIFSVPKTLLGMKPEAYIPQIVSIGPYHHRRSELCDMEKYKLAVARRTQKRLKGQRFESIVQEFHKLEWQIRCCYHKYLDCSNQVLAWLMALDTCFVLEYLLLSSDKSNVGSDHLHPLRAVFDPNGRRASHNAIVRDLMMLENQLPLFLLQKLLEMQFESKDEAENMLKDLIWNACTELSPFKFELPQNLIENNLKQRGHILELLYYALVPTPEDHDDGNATEENESPETDTTPFWKTLKLLWSAFTSINVGPVRRLVELFRRVLNGRAMQILIKLFVRNIPFLRMLKESTLVPKEMDQPCVSNLKEQAPLRDELDIPSVTLLCYAGINFAPTNGDLTTIRFDHTTTTLYLPPVTLDTNTEVILRNLVAFESSAAPGAMVFTRYTDFMNGIIDSAEDVSLLRKIGIIYNHLESDEEVASMWNGMGKCVRLTKVKYLDKVIADINTFYNSRWNVAIMEFVNKYIFGSWQFLSFLAAAILLLLFCFQAFCSAYNCKKSG